MLSSPKLSTKTRLAFVNLLSSSASTALDATAGPCGPAGTTLASPAGRKTRAAHLICISVSLATLSGFLVLILDLPTRARLQACECSANYILPEFQYERLLLLVLVHVVDGEEMLSLFRQQCDGTHDNSKAETPPGFLPV